MDSGVYIMNEMKYLILSTENQCIYTMTPRVITANALVSGDGDSLIKGVTKGNSVDFHKIKNREMFYEKIYMVENKRNSIVEIPSEHVSDSWKRQRDILFLRQEIFYNWETYTATSLARITRHKWDHFDVMAENELAKCNPSNNEFTWIIEEYARVMEVPADRAYKELKLRIESDNITRFRITALAEKWKNKINQGETPEEFSVIKREMVKEFWLNSSI